MGEGKHASVKLYWIICAVLVVVTALEYLIFKVESLRTNAAFMLPTLIIMSVFKFVLVVGWYMHLRYDHGWLTKIFVAALAMAAATGVALTVLM